MCGRRVSWVLNVDCLCRRWPWRSACHQCGGHPGFTESPLMSDQSGISVNGYQMGFYRTLSGLPERRFTHSPSLYCMFQNMIQLKADLLNDRLVLKEQKKGDAAFKEEVFWLDGHRVRKSICKCQQCCRQWYNFIRYFWSLSSEKDRKSWKFAFSNQWLFSIMKFNWMNWMASFHVTP